MVLTDDGWKKLLKKIRKSAMDKNVRLPAENVEALRRKFDTNANTTDEPFSAALREQLVTDDYLNRFVTQSPLFVRRGPRRSIPFKPAAWARVLKMAEQSARDAGARIVRKTPMKAALGKSLKAFIGTDRVSVEGLDRVGDEKVMKHIRSWFSGDAGKSFLKRIRRIEEAVRDSQMAKKQEQRRYEDESMRELNAERSTALAKERAERGIDEGRTEAMKNEMGKQMVVSGNYTKPETQRATPPGSYIGPRDWEAQLYPPRSTNRDGGYTSPRGGRVGKKGRAEQHKAMRSLSGVYLEHVKPDDRIPLRAAAMAYQYVGAAKGKSTIVGRVMGQAPTYTEPPSLGDGWSVVYSDHYQTIWDKKNGKELVVGFVGTKSLEDLLPDLKIGAQVVRDYSPVVGAVRNVAAVAASLATGAGLATTGKVATAVAGAAGFVKKLEGLGSVETDPRMLSVVKTTGTYIHLPEHQGKRVTFTGHSLGNVPASIAYDKFLKTAASPLLIRFVGFEVPFPLASGKPKNWIDGERRRAYVMPNDPLSNRLVRPGSRYNQPNTFIIITTYEPQSLTTSHSIDTLLAHEERRRTDAKDILSDEVEEEVAATSKDPNAGVGSPGLGVSSWVRGEYVDPPGAAGMAVSKDVKQEDPNGAAGMAVSKDVKQEDPNAGAGVSKDVKQEDPPEAAGVGVGEDVKQEDPPEAAGMAETRGVATGDTFRGVPGMGVAAAEPGSGTFGDVVRPELQAAVNAQFHRYGKSFRKYIAEFLASPRYVAMKTETGRDTHDGLDRLIANYGSEIGVAPFDHRALDDKAMTVLYAEVAAIVDWFLRNPERLVARSINRLSVLLETKLFPAEPGTPADQMTDDQLLAQMATRGAVVKLDPSTGRGRALAAVKEMFPGAPGGAGGEAHPSGAATGDAAEAPGNVAGQSDDLMSDGVVEEIDEDTFRLDTTKFIDSVNSDSVRYGIPIAYDDGGYTLSFVE